MKLELLDYALPGELIARHPPERRDGARLLVVGDTLADRRVVELPGLVPEGALVVVNDTRVIPARLLGRKRGTGGKVEVLLVSSLGERRWKALGRSSKPLRAGAVIDVDDELEVRVVGRAATGELEVSLGGDAPELELLDRHGHVPLPPYLARADTPEDRERYQTIFARSPGAVAAPTAGLHLSAEVLEGLRARAVEIAAVTLHVGLGTFQPVSVDDLDAHPMHEEALEITRETAARVSDARASGRPVVAIGTTVVRALESAADEAGRVTPGRRSTRLLIQPGYQFRAVDALLTNFHLPRSTLLALVCAFAGRERVLAAYAHAVAARYRFFSYGDAMLLAR
ncbi:MAG: tRNA preQ1(34) S-adenosylmethionine ribosyltransferase-isomerase QueA [Polyangiaceae bacterium]|nr:tRNA preQ1(34) S-adenosylmethionine ribosyltransferase-isomerase QueA [Polyangiaceae bacterium]